jgi:hypothetical protein
VGAHDVVGGGDGGGDSGYGSWSSEIGGAPSSIPGMAAPATVPASRGDDDADDAPMPGMAAPATVPASGGDDDADDAPMAVGGDRGGGER